MKEDTIGIMEAIMRSDGSIGKTDRERLVGLLRSKPTEEVYGQSDRILRRKEAARLLGRSAKTIDRLVGKGCLGKVTFPGYKRSAGFRLSDIASLIAGGDGE